MASDPDDADLRERVAALEQQVQSQQETIQKLLPSRRQALQAGGLVAGGGLVGALTAGRAAGANGTNDSSTGQVGAAGDSVDVVGDEWLDPGGDTIVNVDDTGSVNAGFGRTWAFDSVSTEIIGNGVHFSAAYPGSDADARLDNALSAANDGDTIFVENVTFNSAHTVSTRLALRSYTNGGARFEAGLTLNQRCLVDSLRIASTLTLNDDAGYVRSVALFGGSIGVAGDQNVLTGITGGSVTFQSGATSNIIDSSSGVTITDNGSGNVTGDIA